MLLHDEARLAVVVKPLHGGRVWAQQSRPEVTRLACVAATQPSGAGGGAAGALVLEQVGRRARGPAGRAGQGRAGLDSWPPPPPPLPLGLCQRVVAAGCACRAPRRSLAALLQIPCTRPPPASQSKRPLQVFSIACRCGACEDAAAGFASTQAFVQQHQQHDARLGQLDPQALKRLHRAQQLSDREATAPPGGACSSLPAELAAVVGQCTWSTCLAVLMQPPEHPAARYREWATALLASGCLNGCTNVYRPWQSQRLPPRLQAAAQAGEPPTLLHRWLAAPCHAHFGTSAPQLSAATSLVVKEAGRLLQKGQAEPSPTTVRSRLKRRLEGSGTPCTVEQLLRVGALLPPCCPAVPLLLPPEPCRRTLCALAS